MRIRIPATSANLGPGFDSLGLAISLYNYVTIIPYTCQSISIKGEGSDRPRLKTNNVFVSIFKDIYQELAGKKENFRFEFENNIEIPLKLFREVHSVLKLNGRFQLVANQHLNYKVHLEKIFSEVEILGELDKFVVYECVK